MADPLLGVDALLLLAPYGPLPVVEEPHATMKSARVKLMAKKRAFLECFMCWILLCCLLGSLRGYKNDEVGHHWRLKSATQRCASVVRSLHLSIRKRVTPSIGSPLAQARTPRHVRKAHHAAGSQRSPGCASQRATDHRGCRALWGRCRSYVCFI